MRRLKRLRNILAGLVAYVLAATIVSAAISRCSPEGSETPAGSGGTEVESTNTANEGNANIAVGEGPVWVLTREAYTREVDGAVTAQGSYDITLDAQGNQVNIKSENYDETDSFDEKGYPVEAVVTYASSGESGTVAFACEYDAEGRLSKATAEDGYTYEYAYGSNGYLSKRTTTNTVITTDEDGTEREMTSTQTLTFDEDGYPTMLLTGYEGEGLITSTYEYEYGDDPERPIGHTVTFSDEAGVGSSTTTTITYDENGNVARTETVTDAGTEIWEYEYELVDAPSVWAAQLAHLKNV